MMEDDEYGFGCHRCDGAGVIPTEGHESVTGKQEKPCPLCMGVTVYDCDVPDGYAETMGRLNRPGSWDVPGMIDDMCDKIRSEQAAPAGELLAAMDWMVFRLKEARELLFVIGPVRSMEHDDSRQVLLRRLEGF